MTAIFTKRYLIGNNQGEMFENNLEIREIKVNGKKVVLSGSVPDGDMAIRKISFSEKNETVNVSFQKVQSCRN